MMEGNILYVGSLFEKLEAYLSSNEYKEKLKEEKRLRKALNKFLNLFTIEKIKTMTKEDYCLGLENSRKSFCYYVEKLLNYGAISGRTNAYQKFVLYYDKKEKQFKFGDKRTKHRRGFGSEVEEIFENIKKHLASLIEDIKNKNYEGFCKNPINEMVKNKIAFLYDSENQIPIYGEKDLDIILAAFAIPFNSTEERIYKRIKLFDFYKKLELDKKVSPYIFMSFIYNDLGYRSLLKNKSADKNIKAYKLIDVTVKSKSDKSAMKRKSNKPIIIDNANEEKKRVIGKQGEQIVWDYLKEHETDMKISDLKAWCLDETIRDDSKGFDFSYKDKNGNEIFVEVKSTSRDYKDKVYFEISAKEYEVMQKNLDHYYFFFINNINCDNIIKRIKASDITEFKPTHFSVGGICE